MAIAHASSSAAAASALSAAGALVSIVAVGETAPSITSPDLRSMSAINRLLERFFAGAGECGEEAFPLVALREVCVDNGLDHIRHDLGGEAWADDLADRRVVLAGAAERDLVVLGPLLIHP